MATKLPGFKNFCENTSSLSNPSKQNNPSNSNTNSNDEDKLLNDIWNEVDLDAKKEKAISYIKTYVTDKQEKIDAIQAIQAADSTIKVDRIITDNAVE